MNVPSRKKIQWREIKNYIDLWYHNIIEGLPGRMDGWIDGWIAVTWATLHVNKETKEKQTEKWEKKRLGKSPAFILNAILTPRLKGLFIDLPMP
jgi:hypothetical protein